jgi:uncharacterized protein
VNLREQLSAETRQKVQRCREILRGLQRVVVAFSAGADSTLLLSLAIESLGKDNVVAAMGVSPSLAERERLAGRDIARTLGAELVEIRTGEMDDPNYAANPADRCFHCKSDLFRRLEGLAEQRGLAAVVSGANADDTGDFRPGLQAGREMGVVHPLMEAGMTKDEVREASKAMGLPTWDKPAMACLASRVPYGQPITAEKLSRIERAEYVLKDLGFAQCRVRDHDTIARIELPVEDLPRAIRQGDRIAAALKALGYTYVTLDLEGFRSGSMNEPLRREK